MRTELKEYQLKLILWFMEDRRINLNTGLFLYVLIIQIVYKVTIACKVIFFI